MTPPAPPLLAVDLSTPGHYVTWSIFTASVANLVVIGVMVLVFALALLLPFPKTERGETGPGSEDSGPPAPPAGTTGPSASAAGADADMWTAKLRRRLLGILPPERLIPDRQPAYVASWVYVFGVAAMAALACVIGSGFVIALGGTDWWHTNPVGHFFNSLHLWSVEIFMAVLVVHLWGKFWMAAWRGRRSWTWMTGVVAFLVSIVAAFTGYLSQQNFDSQWISTNGKDAFNAAGVGAFFNLMNTGQMLLWHVVLVPVVLVTIVGIHVLLVRVRGVSHPLPDRKTAGSGTPRPTRRELAGADAAPWTGPTRRYDILKEGTIAATVVLVLVFLLAGLLSSPDLPPVTLRTWVQVSPADFLATTASELAGTSETAQYGPPYNNESGSVQRIGISWQSLAGVHDPIDAAQDFVLGPLAKTAPTDPALAVALRTYEEAPAGTRQSWDNAYLTAVAKVTFHGGTPSVPKADDGPVPLLAATELTLARSGALDSDLTSHASFYGNDFTQPLLFLEDGNYFANTAQNDHLTGSQWGVMNETGNYPGQPWLWLYQLWYQLPGFRSSANVDLIAIYLTGVATVLLLAVPFIPGLRDVPRLVPVHRLIWRSWYRTGPVDAQPSAAPAPGAGEASPAGTPKPAGDNGGGDGTGGTGGSSRTPDP